MKEIVNPFTEIQQQLAIMQEKIDRLPLMIENLNADSAIKTALPEIGGIELAVTITGLSSSTIYAKKSKNLIPHRKKGNKLFFLRDELLAWIKSGEQNH